MDTRLLHLAAYGCTPKAHPANAAIVVFPVGLLWWRPRRVACRDQFVRRSSWPRAGLPADVGRPLAHAPSEPPEICRVPHLGWRDVVEVIGDRAETVALMFRFGRATGPPPFEISN
jgi:hypothetical protein